MIPGYSAQALVNVLALSERILRRDIQKSGFTAGPEIQGKRLKPLHNLT